MKRFIHDFWNVRWTTYIFLVLFPHLLFAQQRCGTSAAVNNALIEEPAYEQGLDSLEALARRFEASLIDDSRDGFKGITIPVVVHVIYREEEFNISVDQIHSQIEVLNRDFNLENADVERVPDAFRGLARSSKIRFALADKDPDGNFTNGITRTLTTVENIGTENLYHRTSQGGHDPWPQPHYLNIWVCETEGNVLGFALLPGASMSQRDGVVMNPRAFGTRGTVQTPYDGGRTCVHEVGHYLGLRHPWGSEEGVCTGTDYMSDTPVQREGNFGCKTFPSFSCPNEPNGDMFMNYMDYGNDTCMLLFTERQVSFMQLVLKTSRSALFNSPAVTGREELVLSSFSITPNPSNGYVRFEILGGEQSTYEIYTIDGHLVQVITSSADDEFVDLNHLRSGIYIVRNGSDSKRLIITND